MVVVSVLIGLVGCQSKSPTIEGYLLDPELAILDYNQCRASLLNQQQESQRCVIVGNVVPKLAKLLNEANEHPQAFGQRIIAAQIQLVKQQQQLDKLTAMKSKDKQINALKQKIAKTELTINGSLAILKFLFAQSGV